MISQIFTILNHNRFFNGCATIMLHIGGRYISSEVPKNLEIIFNKKWLRRLFVFCVAFISTRDIKLSILLTLLFIVLFKYLLDDQSNFCLIKKEIPVETKTDRAITHEELLRAKQIIDKYNDSLEGQKIMVKKFM